MRCYLAIWTNEGHRERVSFFVVLVEEKFGAWRLRKLGDARLLLGVISGIEVVGCEEGWALSFELLACSNGFLGFAGVRRVVHEFLLSSLLLSLLL